MSESLEIEPSGPMRLEHERAIDPSDELEEIRRGLERSPREIHCKHFYDEAGSRLFERICALDEYYPTRTEHEILTRIAPRIAELTQAEELLELGSGAATKTALLLDALRHNGRLRRYLPFDVNGEGLRAAASRIAAAYPGIAVQPIEGDFARDLCAIPPGERRLTIFLGGTIGNFRPVEAEHFLAALAETMRRGDYLLLGSDLVKNRTTLENAYNDAQGVTAEFNRNILRNLNRKLDADFDPDAFAHRAFYDRESAWIEMRLVARARQVVFARKLGWELEIAEGEEILTEISAKFDRPRIERLYESTGFRLEHWFTDALDLFAVSLARRV